MFDFLNSSARLSAGDLRAINRALGVVADTLRERLQGLDAEIAELRAEVERLKREPRQSFAQKLREKGKP
jgi:hypothetical protein